ncbi:MFS transporter [Pseudomonas sp. gcc21]|uniref:MFS transporter n=1 Tax=Pseudomonas sp. gcc21 TaxID=2726989 RepID=UPI001451F6AD|nr:MFS transporter [Pseudomonas sp. gcc21]QJD58125.1 MFS transporter [Pseudomonas sp. gcc21]
MLNESEYQTVWMIYLAAAACAWLVWWQMTRWIKWWFVREPLWVIAAVLLFVPARVDPAEPWMAPAFFIWLLDTLFDTGDNVGRMLGNLSLALVIAGIAYVGLVLLRAGWRHWRGRSNESAAAAR